MSKFLNFFKISKIERNSKKRVIKNLLAINVAFLLIFASSNGLTSVQAILNQDGNLGIISQILIFCVQIPLSISFPTIFIDYIGFKYTMIVAEICYAIYVAANTYPKYFTIIPASIIIGVSQSLVWTLLGIYLAILSEQYASLTGRTFKNVQTTFVSIFSCLFLSSYVLSNILISTILKTSSSKANSTFDYATHCGFNDCPYTKLPVSTSQPSLNSVYGFCGALLGLVLLALVITILFMDNRPDKTLPKETVTVNEERKMKSKMKILFLCKRLKEESNALFKIPKKLDLLLLLPITAYTGFEITILWNEFNRSFVTCVFNLKYVGFTNIVFGITGAILSPLFGYLTKYTSHIAFIVFMLMVSIANSIFMLTWVPNPASLHVIFLMAIAFGISQSYGNGQVRGLFVIHITDNKIVFTYATLFQTIGFFIGFLLSLYTCTSVKAYFYFAISAFSLICYVVLIYRENRYQIQEINKIMKEDQDLRDEITNQQTSNELIENQAASTQSSANFKNMEIVQD